MQPQYNEGAGKSLRREAQQLRTKALYRYGAATGLGLLPVLVLYALAPFAPLFFFVAAIVIGALIAIPLIKKGNKFWKSSQIYDQGACGEEKTEQVLKSLTQSGWIAEYNLILPQVGDIDVWLRSPKGVNFILEVKSHSTVVQLDGNVLKRLSYDGKLIDFKKDFLAQIANQVTAIKKAKKLTKVTPVVVFSEAKVILINKKKIRGAYVMELGNLVSRLQELERTYKSR